MNIALKIAEVLNRDRQERDIQYLNSIVKDPNKETLVYSITAEEIDLLNKAIKNEIIIIDEYISTLKHRIELKCNNKAVFTDFNNSPDNKEIDLYFRLVTFIDLLKNSLEGLTRGTAEKACRNVLNETYDTLLSWYYKRDIRKQLKEINRLNYKKRHYISEVYYSPFSFTELIEVFGYIAIEDEGDEIEFNIQDYIKRMEEQTEQTEQTEQKAKKTRLSIIKILNPGSHI